MTTETELKISLQNELEWQTLCAALGEPSSIVLQHNRFFDTPEGALRQHKLALRVRTQGQASWLTLKGPKQMVHHAARRLEIEVPLEDSSANLLQLDLPPIHELRRRVPVTHLVEIVRFDNWRRAFPVTLAGQELLLEVDRTRYANTREDFEVEVEVPGGYGAHQVSAVASELELLLQRQKIPYRLQHESKFYRALQNMS